MARQVLAFNKQDYLIFQKSHDAYYPQHSPQRNNRSKFKKEFILISELFLSKD